MLFHLKFQYAIRSGSLPSPPNDCCFKSLLFSAETSDHKLGKSSLVSFGSRVRPDSAVYGVAGD
jgi:hypothetical protein